MRALSVLPGVVAVITCSIPCLLAAPFNDAAPGAYNVNATWGAGSNPANGTADTVTIDEYTVAVSGPGHLNNDTISVIGPGIFDAGGNEFNYLDGAILNLANDGSMVLGRIWVTSVSSAEIRMSNGNASILQSNLENTGYRIAETFRYSGSAGVLTFGTTASPTPGAGYPVLAFTNSYFTTDAMLNLSSTRVRLQFYNVDLPTNISITCTNTGDAIFAGTGNTDMRGTVNWNSGGIMDCTAAEALGSATVNVYTGYCRSSALYALSNATVNLHAGTVLDMTDEGGSGDNHRLTGARINLYGGSVAIPRKYYDPSFMGGQFVVRADNSWFSCNTENGEVTTFESISFQSESATLALRDTGGGGTISPVFRRAEVMANTVLLIEDQCPTTFSNLHVRAGTTLTHTNAGSLRLKGTFTPWLPGGAALIAANEFTAVDSSGASAGLVKSHTLETSEGLWSTSNSTAKTLVVTVGKNKGSMSVGSAGVTCLPEADTGHVTVTGMTPGKSHSFMLVLGTFDPGKTVTDVAARLSAEPAFSNVAVRTSTSVKFDVTATGTTGCFVWDNINPSNKLLANVKRFASFYALGTTIVVY